MLQPPRVDNCSVEKKMKPQPSDRWLSALAESNARQSSTNRWALLEACAAMLGHGCVCTAPSLDLARATTQTAQWVKLRIAIKLGSHLGWHARPGCHVHPWIHLQWLVNWDLCDITGNRCFWGGKRLGIPGQWSRCREVQICLPRCRQYSRTSRNFVHLNLRHFARLRTDFSDFPQGSHRQQRKPLSYSSSSLSLFRIQKHRQMEAVKKPSSRWRDCVMCKFVDPKDEISTYKYI